MFDSKYLLKIHDIQNMYENKVKCKNKAKIFLCMEY